MRVRLVTRFCTNGFVQQGEFPNRLNKRNASIGCPGSPFAYREPDIQDQVFVQREWGSVQHWRCT